MNRLATPLPSRLLPPLGSRRALLLLERNARLYLRHRVLFLTGVVEPLLFLLSIGIGLGGLVGPIRVGDTEVPYAAFVAPALLATSAMNGAMIDSIFNLFFKLKITHLYDSVLATPLDANDVALGEIGWAVVRGLFYAATFVAIMAALGDVRSWMVVFCLPASVLLSAAFAAVGMAATTHMRSWQDFDMVSLVFMPLFLFSGTFYPISAYPSWLGPHRGGHAAVPGRGDQPGLFARATPLEPAGQRRLSGGPVRRGLLDGQPAAQPAPPAMSLLP